MDAQQPHKYLITQKGYDFFTPQLVRVLKLLLNKIPRKQIAVELHISPYTLRNHCATLRKLLKVKNDVGIYEACVMEGYAALDKFE